MARYPEACYPEVYNLEAFYAEVNYPSAENLEVIHLFTKLLAIKYPHDILSRVYSTWSARHPKTLLSRA